MLAWVLFLIHDFRKKVESPPLITCLILFGHLWLAVLFLATSKVAENHRDPWLIYFGFLIVFRYIKTVTNVFFWFRYKPATAINGNTPVTKDCTVIVPTVGPKGNASFEEMVAGILYNKPMRLIFSANTPEAEEDLKEYIPSIKKKFINGETGYQLERGFPGFNLETECFVVNANISNKREQVVFALQHVDTPIVVFADDTACWHPSFLNATLPSFTVPKVAFVGTRKWVKRLPRPSPDPDLPWYMNLWARYTFGFWNTIGALYLLRHNFEARATSAADGGIFCVSGRTHLIRSPIVKDPVFQDAFTNEHILVGIVPGYPDGFGPVAADDDNFLTRWVINRGWDVHFQYTEEATMTTVLGKQGGSRFIDQCKRWSRTTMRQNPIALFEDRTIWWKWPVTVWTTYFPWLYNAALFWDPLIVFTLTRTEFFKTSERPGCLVAGLVGFIWLTKLIKTIPWFVKYPQDFLLYFFPIPAYPLFAYGHSILKFWTMFTFWDLSWSGRKLPPSPQLKSET